VVALRAAGVASQGATIYTTLEPCTFHARTPPCTSAIIEAEIRSVFYVARDNDPRIGSGAEELLRPVGIKVGFLRDPDGVVAEMLAPFRCRVAAGRPLITAKYAMTLDGRIATASGDSRWVSGSESRRRVHILRDQVDAIMVGVGTVVADDPQLTTRIDGHWRPARHPLRVVVDSQGRAPLSSRIFDQTLPGETLVAGVAPSAAWVSVLRERGIVVEILPGDADGRVDLVSLLKLLAVKGVNHLLVEGGSELLGALNDLYLIDRIEAYIAPKLVGGIRAPGPLAGIGLPLMAGAREFELRRVERLGDDVLLVATANSQPWWQPSIVGIED